MPLSSSGSPSTFAQILPGAPSASLQALSRFLFRLTGHVAYISGSQLNILSSPDTLVQSLVFPEELVSIIAEDGSGKIVVASRSAAFVLQPVTEGWTKLWWEKTICLKCEDAGNAIQSLSWGDQGEVLVGGSHGLSLFSSRPGSRGHSPVDKPAGDEEFVEKRSALWSIPVSSPVLFAEFSPSATLIASCAQRDRLVKIWRRLSFEEGLFDYSYLPHSGLVTHLEWRPLEDTSEERRSSSLTLRHEEQPEVLYTIASDGMLRIWRTASSLDASILIPFTSIDLASAIPQSPTITTKGSQPRSPVRFVFFIPSDRFCAAVTAAMGLPQEGKVNHFIEHLKEIISQQPDIVVALDGHGRMSAWGLQSIGHKRRPETPTISEPYHVAHAEGLPLRFGEDAPTIISHWFQDNTINLLAHSIGKTGQMSWWEGDLETFFSPSAAGADRLQLKCIWGGHGARIISIGSSARSLVSWSDHRHILWDLTESGSLQSVTSTPSPSPVLAASVIEPSRLVITAHPNELCLWDAHGNQIAAASHSTIEGGKISVLTVTRGSASGVFVDDRVQAVTLWTANFSAQKGSFRSSLDLQSTRVSIDVAGHHMVPLPSPSSCTSLSLVSITGTGQIRKIFMSSTSTSKFESAAAFETGVSDPSLLSVNPENAALVDGKGKHLCIIDLADGYIEYSEQTAHAITQLQLWKSDPTGSLLALGSSMQIMILAKGRYSHAAPVWMTVKIISLTHAGPDIGALAWASNSDLSVAAGNSIMLPNMDVAREELQAAAAQSFDVNNIDRNRVPARELSNLLQAALPIWSSSAVSDLLLRGHLNHCAEILNQLAQKLKFWSPGDELSLDLGGSQLPYTPSPASHQQLNISDETFGDLREQLSTLTLPHITLDEQRELRHIVDAIAYLRDHRKGLDQNAVRYLYSWKLRLLRAGGPDSLSGAPEMDWQAISFAHRSTTQQPLLDILTLHYDNKITWATARSLGLLAWLKEREALEQVFEQLAQAAYRRQQPPDPVDASLFFLTLRKKPTLMGLWRIATWHKEQKSTMNFLKRDFNQADAKTAAKKNAYALMGKRRFEYSAAFFLLGDDPQSAVNALASQCEDALLAIAVARIYCGDDSAVLAQLIQDRLLPQAKGINDRWYMSWCHAILADTTNAAEALVQPLSGVKQWQHDDPRTLLLYREVRLRTHHYESEAHAVLRSARLLRRIGLWDSALALVATWDFLPPTRPIPAAALPDRTTATATNGIHEATPSVPSTISAPPSMLDGFTEPQQTTPAASVDGKTEREAKAAELLRKLKEKKIAAAALAAPVTTEKKPPPTQFKEPDANSLLDSFGF